MRRKQAKNLFDLGHGNILLNTSPDPRETKTKMHYWDQCIKYIIKIKSFYTAKETIGKTKRQPMEWEKIFANEVSDKRLVSKIYKELIKHPKHNPVKKWAKDMNRHFSKEDIQMAN